MSAHDESLRGKSVLVTGAASGIGLAVVRALSEAGAELALLDVDRERLAHAAAELHASRPPLALLADVRDPAAVTAAVDTAQATLESLDGLVNCAGVYPVTGLLDLTPDEWDRVIDTNLRGPFLLTQAVARVMKKGTGGGSIVNVSSTASTVARPGIAHYGSSKAGLNQLTRVAAVELARYSIRVNAVLPGVIATDRVLDAASSIEAKRELDAKVHRIPAGRLGRPEEVVPLILFLLSDASSYCTGGLFTVDGGFSLGLSRY